MMPHYRERVAIVNRVFAHPAAPILTGAGFFCQNTDAFVDDTFAGRFTEPTGRNRLPRVHADDIGLLNARVTLDPPASRVLACEGPLAVSGPDAAAMWAEELGRPVTYLGPGNDQWRASMERHTSGKKLQDFADTLAVPMRFDLPVSRSRLAETTRLLGRPPKSYRDYVRETVDRAVAEGRTTRG